MSEYELTWQQINFLSCPKEKRIILKSTPYNSLGYFYNIYLQSIQKIKDKNEKYS